MTYSVKEIFYTLQGEGARTGRPAVFCRFAGCNLWSGREQDRAKAVCTFCDTDFRGTDGECGGTHRTADQLAGGIAGACAAGATAPAQPFVVYTREGLLQLDKNLIHARHPRGLRVAVETNGVQATPPGLDWDCFSPRSDAKLARRVGIQLKLSTRRGRHRRSVLATGLRLFLSAAYVWAAVGGPHGRVPIPSGD